MIPKRIFICSPYRGDVEKNKMVAKALCLRAIATGASPYAPHLYLPEVLDDNVPHERKAGIDVGLSFLRLCDEMWIYPHNGITEGMRKEIAMAGQTGIRRIAITKPILFSERIRYIADWLGEREAVVV
jgi:hypothetical protein